MVAHIGFGVRALIPRDWRALLAISHKILQFRLSACRETPEQLERKTKPFLPAKDYF
jgi:hypothetical protein